MGLTWIAIASSLLMGSAGLLIFVWSVRSHMFKDFEDVKYQVFWSDSSDGTRTTAKNAIPKNATEEQRHGSSTKDDRAR
jgi:cbb3-type cytochrome oxidase maturation protein